MAVRTLRAPSLRAALPPERLAELEAAEREAAEGRPVEMTIRHVLDEARRRTGGLADFGPMDFTERLGLLLAEVEADAGVWAAAKRGFVERCTAAAVNRLCIQDYRRRHPESAELPIERPVNVVAVSRSGSTHLENLLAADRRLRHLPNYLAAQPAPLPGEAPAPGRADPRWGRGQTRWERLSRDPLLAAMHEQSPDHACGENELQTPDFAGYQWEWIAEVPGFREHYLGHDQTPHYRWMRRVLSVITHQFPDGRRWMLKSNQHAEQLGPLLSVYPDATVVMIHRDPVATLASLLTMRGTMVRNSRRRPDVEAHTAYWTARLEGQLRSYLRDRGQVPGDRLVEIDFERLVADDVGTAAGVLERAGLPATADCLADLTSYQAAHPRGAGGRVVYDLEGDFGLDPARLRERFAFYTEEVGLR
jgi:hypothetical protein